MRSKRCVSALNDSGLTQEGMLQMAQPIFSWYMGPSEPDEVNRYRSCHLQEKYVGEEHVPSPDRSSHCASDARLFVRSDCPDPSSAYATSVPAEYASFELPDALLSRLSNDGTPDSGRELF